MKKRRFAAPFRIQLIVCVFLAFAGNIQSQIINPGPSPNQAWNTTITNLSNALLAADTADHFIVAGTAQNASADLWVGEFGEHGRLLWTATYDGSAHLNDAVTALAVDPSNNVFVAGFSAASASATNLALIKYSSSGITQWVRFQPGLQVPAKALGTDAVGDIYAAGTLSLTNGGSSIEVIKWDANGNQMWMRTYVDTNAIGSSASGIAVDPAGDCFVLATNLYRFPLPVGGGHIVDEAILKYDGSGNLLWQLITTNTYPGLIALDASVNVITVGGHIVGLDRQGDGLDIDIVSKKMDTLGHVLWRNEVSEIDGYPTNTLDRFEWVPTGLDLDDSGFVHVTAIEGFTDIDYPPIFELGACIVYSGQGDIVFQSGFGGFAWLSGESRGDGFMSLLPGEPSTTFITFQYSSDRWAIFGGYTTNFPFAASTWSLPHLLQPTATICNSFGNLGVVGFIGTNTYLEKDVFSPPKWASQLTNYIVRGGTTLTINPQITGSELNVQWSLDGETLSSGTNLDLSLDSISTNQAGAYQVFIANPAGSVMAWSHMVVGGWSPSYLIDPVPGVTAGLNVLHYGIPGGVYELDATGDLFQWSAAGRFTNDLSGQCVVQTSGGAGSSRQFYRTRLIP